MTWIRRNRRLTALALAAALLLTGVWNGNLIPVQKAYAGNGDNKITYVISKGEVTKTDADEQMTATDSVSVEISADKLFDSNGQAQAPEGTEREGYQFKGWCYRTSAEDSYQEFTKDMLTSLAEDIFVYAKWEAGNIAVEESDLLTGTPPESQAMLSSQSSLQATITVIGESIEVTGVYPVSGYEVVWYTDKDKQVNLSVNTVIKDDTVLYSEFKLESNLYDISGDGVYHDEQEQKYYYKDISSVTITPKSPAKSYGVAGTQDNQLTDNNKTIILSDKESYGTEGEILSKEIDLSSVLIKETVPTVNTSLLYYDDNKEYDNQYTNKNLKIKVQVTEQDESSGIQSVQYSSDGTAYSKIEKNEQDDCYYIQISDLNSEIEEEKSYQYHFKVTTKCGTIVEEQKEFQIKWDNKAPTITVSAETGKINEYTNSDTSIKVTAQDSGSGTDNSFVKYTVKEVKDNTENLVGSENQTLGNDGKISLACNEGEAAQYKVYITAADKLGNVVKNPVETTIKIDKKAPEVQINTATTPSTSITGSDWHNGNNNYVEVTGSDTDSGIDKKPYGLKAENSLVTISVDEADNSKAKYSVGQTGASGTTFTPTLTDKAGNVSSTEDISMKVDTTAPELSVAVYHDEERKETCDLEAETKINKTKYIDINSNDSLSKLHSIEYCLKQNNNIVNNSLQKKEYTQNTETDNFIWQLNTEDYTDGNYQLYVKIQDYAGNISEWTKNIIIDNTAPNFSVSVKKNGTAVDDADLENTYFNEAVFEISLISEEPDGFVYYLTENTEFSKDVPISADENYHVEYTINKETLLQDNVNGSKTWYIWAEDSLGNHKYLEKKLNIDVQNPTAGDMSVTKMEDGKEVSVEITTGRIAYVNKNVTLKIQNVKDNASGISAVQYSTDEEFATGVGILTDKENTGSYSCEFLIESLNQGDNIYYFRVIDGTGNISDNLPSINLYRDQVEPTIEVKGYIGEETELLVNEQWVKEKVIFHITPEDLGSQIKSLYVLPSGAEQPVEIASQNGAYQYTVEPAAMEQGQLHTYQFWTVDNAGNKSQTQEKSFYYDNVSPAVEIDITTKKGSLDNSVTINDIKNDITLDYSRMTNLLPVFKLTFSDMVDNVQGSGIASVQKYICTTNEAVDNGLTKLENIKNLEWEDAVTEITNDGTAEVSVSWDKNPDKYIAFFKVTDKVGNITYAASNGIVFDNAAPKIELNYKSGEKDMSGTWTNEKLDILVTIRDVLSGICEYHVYKEENGVNTELINYKYINSNTEKEEGQESRFTISQSELADGNYNIIIEATDKTGNSSSNSVNVKKDQMAPEIELVYAKDGVWTNQRLAVTASVNEKGDETAERSNLKSVKYFIDSEDATQIFDLKEEPKPGYDFEITADDLKEGNYIVRLSAEDQAGNIQEKQVNVRKDLQKATGEIKIKENIWQSFLQMITFGLFYSESADVSVNAWDKPADNVNETSQVQSIQYYKTKDILSENACGQLSDDSWTDYEAAFDIHPDEAFIIYVKIIDKAGNVAYLSSNGIVVDETTPEIDIKYLSDKTDMSGTWTNQELDISVEIRDILSGIREYHVYKIEGEEKTELEKYKYENENPEKEENQTETFTIKADELADGNYSIFVEVYDKAKNYYSNQVNVKKDTIKPSTNLTYHKDNIWTNEELTIMGDSEENGSDLAEHSNLKSVKYYIDSTEVTKSFLFTEEDNQPAHQFQIKPEDLKEGSYIVKVIIEDYAGNTAEDSVQVKKDTTNPTGQITIKKDNVWKSFLEVITFGLFYKSSADVTIQAEDIPAEHVNETSGVKLVQYYKTKDILTSDDCSKLSADSWTEYKDMFEVNPDEAFIIYVKITDEAGSVTYLSSNGIVLDKTEPEINIQYVSGKTDMSGIWTNQRLDISVEIQDMLSGIANYHVYKIEDGEKTELENYKYENSNQEKQENQTETFTIKADEVADGNYTIFVEAYDKTGNYYSDEINVKKDTLKPSTNLTYEKDQIWTNEELAITGDSAETGDDSVKRSNIRSVKYYIDSENPAKTFEYTEENSPSVHHFEIPASDLKEDDYIVKVIVEDYAGNTAEDTVRVRKDLANPVGTIQASADGTYSFTEKIWETGSNYKASFRDKVTYALFADNKVTISLSAEDKNESIATSGVDYIEYFRTAEDFTLEQCRDSLVVPETKWIKVNGTDGAATQSFTVDKTGEFITYLRITDKAGNVSYLKSDGIAVDKEDSDIRLVYEAENTWTNQNLTISVTVSDAFAGLSQIKTYRDYNGTTTDLTEYFYDSFSSIKTENETKSYTIAAKDLPEGSYTIRVAVVDKAGNASEKSIKVKKDRTPSTGQITIGDFGTWRNFLNVITFGLFKNSAVPVNISSEDIPASGINETSQVASIEYLRTSEIYTTIGQCEAASGWSYINGANTAFTASPDQNMVIYARIQDNAGNITYICSNGIVLDSAASSADISKPVATVTAKPITNDIFSDSVEVSFMVADPITAGSVTSGLNTVTYKIVNRDTGYETVPVTAYVLEGVLGRYGQRTGSASKAILAESSTYGGIINVPAEYFNSNHVEIILDAVDNAGNVMQTALFPLQIDVTAPTVNVTYDNNTVGGYEKYFSSARTINMAVTERNFNPAAVRLIITKDGAENVISGDTLSWMLAENTAVSNGDGNIYTAQYIFEEDADYTVRMECSDLAGNVCTAFTYEGAAAQEFTIDNIDPAIQTTAESGYTSEARTVTATIQEHNFEAADAAVLVTKRLNGAVVYTDQVMSAAWSDAGDTHMAALTFAEDGDYTFVITYKDKAGRNAVSYTSPEFTVDNTNPVLLTNVSAENRNIANKGDIEFVYTYYDINSAMENGMISYKLTTLSGRAVNWEPVIENVSVEGVNGYTLRFSDFAQTAALSDGIYILNVVVKDKAGRSESNTVTFSVNRKGSAYDYEETSYLASVIKAAYVQKIEEDLQIVVVNCDDVTGYQVIIYNSLNEEIVLTPETDYIWELASTDNDGWKKYICTIKKSVFAKNGTYNILILTKDNADDSMYGENATFTSNQDAVEEYRMELNFTVDNISPEVVLSGVKDGENYDLDTDIKIDYSDANNIASVEVERLLDNRNSIDSKAYTQAEISKAGEKSGRLVFTAAEYNDFQTVQVTVQDIAGNAETQTVRILITSNAWIKFINNTPAVIATITGIAAAAAVTALIIIRKKKKKEAS